MSETEATAHFKGQILAQFRPDGHDEIATIYRRTEIVDRRQRRLTESDMREVLVLTGAFSSVAMLPRTFWLRYSALVAGIRHSRFERKDLKDFGNGVRAVLGPISDTDVRSIFRQYREHLVRRRLLIAREFNGFRTPPRFSVHGAEALKSAAIAGKGAIVWSNPFVYHTLTGQALLAAGIHSSRVSASVHGFSMSDFGRATFNRLAVQAENRYLRERLVFGPNEGQSVTRKIASTLASGEIVSMTNNTFAGSVFLELPIGQSGALAMAATPLSFAVKRRVPLFCASIIETEPLQVYEMHLSEIPNDVVADRGNAVRSRDHEAMARMGLQVRNVLARHLKRWPEQYGLWKGLAHSKINHEDG